MMKRMAFESFSACRFSPFGSISSRWGPSGRVLGKILPSSRRPTGGKAIFETDARHCNAGKLFLRDDGKRVGGDRADRSFEIDGPALFLRWENPREF